MSRYDDALEEFNQENEDGKHRLVYAYFGLAVYHCQILEEAFVNMLFTNRIIKESPTSNQQVREIINTVESSKKTLGKLLGEIKQNYGLSDKHSEELEKVLEDRNFLIHRYFRVEIFKFSSQTGMKEMIKYFCDLVEQINYIDRELQNYFASYKLALGITEEKLREIMVELQEQEKLRDNQ